MKKASPSSVNERKDQYEWQELTRTSRNEHKAGSNVSDDRLSILPTKYNANQLIRFERIVSHFFMNK